MTHVVTLACERCKYTDCVDVCPTDAFHEGPEMLVIHPDDCIDCAVCVVECPVSAIVADEDLPLNERDTLQNFNRERSMTWPVITKRQEPLAPRPAAPRVQSREGH
jgi:ferredoxin